jgi:hypothetical protein
MPDPCEAATTLPMTTTPARPGGSLARVLLSRASPPLWAASPPVLQRAPTTSSRSLYARGAHIPCSSSHVSPLLQSLPSHPRTRMPATPAWYEVGQPQLFPWAIPGGAMYPPTAYVRLVPGDPPPAWPGARYTGPSAAASLGASYVAAGWYAGLAGECGNLTERYSSPCVSPQHGVYALQRFKRTWRSTGALSLVWFSSSAICSLVLILATRT